MYEGGAKRERRGAAKEIHRFLHTIDSSKTVMQALANFERPEFECIMTMSIHRSQQRSRKRLEIQIRFTKRNMPSAARWFGHASGRIGWRA
jgi:hypothetical protein